MRTSDRHDLLRRRSFGICRRAKWGMTSEAKSSRVSPSFRSPLISRSMPAPRYCRIRSICWMPDMQTKFVAANRLRFEVLEQGTGVRLALCLHGFPEHAISWRHQIPVLAGMGYRVWAVNQRGYGRLRLQLSLELVEKAEIGPVCEDALGIVFDHAELVRPQRVESHGVLSIRIPASC